MTSILVIEDVALVLSSLRIALECMGHRVTGASNGVRGLELMQGTAFDLVVTDIWMPGLNGVEVIRMGRERLPKARFLAITGGDPNAEGPARGSQLQSFGADRVLLKPFDMDELLDAISALLK